MPTGTVGTVARGYHTKQIHYLRGTLGTNVSSAVTVTLGVIPASSAVIEAWTIVTTAFNAGSTNTVTIGNTASAAAYSSLTTVGSTGRKVGTTLVSAAGATVMPTADTTITATYTPTGTGATAGSAEIVFEYAVLN